MPSGSMENFAQFNSAHVDTLPSSFTYPDRSRSASSHLFNTTTLGLAIAAWVLYHVCLGIYRVYFGPVSKIPGPKLSALTTWYQGYFDLWLYGKYIFKIDELHKEYGPVIRINPHEVHINDPEFVDVVFAGPSKRRDKYRWTGRMVTIPDSTVSTISHDLHRKRRGALNPYFSKQSIRKLEPVFHDTLRKLLKRFDECKESGEVFPVTYAMKATTSDIVTGYCFGKSENSLDKRDYNKEFFDTIHSTFLMSHWFLHIGFLSPLLSNLPPWLVPILLPGMGELYKWQQQWSKQIEEIRASEDEKFGTNTIFHGLLHSNLPEEEKSSYRMMQEAQLLVIAGQDTTATTLALTFFQVMDNPDIFKKLRKELIEAIPDDDSLPTCAQVEKLPYLTAVIQEGLRLHPGAILRTQRVAPDEHLVFRNGDKGTVTIPAGTAISTSAPAIQMNPAVFKDPYEFRPERWIENPRLDRHLMALSKGTRMCLGINLAYQELYLVLAGIFRKYDLYDGSGTQGPSLQLYDTTRERDVDLVSDLIIPLPQPDSKGIRVLVK